MEYGETFDSRVMANGIYSDSILIWRINKIIDVNGNYIDFVYNNSDRDSRIEKILYTGNLHTSLTPYNELNFSYTNRVDINTIYEAGVSLSSKYLLDKISVIHTNDAGLSENVKTYKLNYGFDNINSMLKEIVEYGGDLYSASLNSTIFLYGDQSPTNLVVETTPQFIGECITGDFNADGKSDILANTSYYDNTIKYSSGYKILLNPLLPNVFYEKTLPAGHTIAENKKFVNYMTSDFNGDGRDDVLNLKTKYVTYPSGYSERKIESISAEFTTNTGSFTQGYPLPVNKVIHSSGNFFIPGDFDGDGNQDYITMLGSASGTGSGQTYSAKLCTPSEYIGNIHIYGFTVDNDYTPMIIITSDKTLTLDFDGDGKQEVLVVKGTQTTILRLVYETNGTDVYYLTSNIFITNEINSDDKVFIGDFNGDKKSDLLVKKANGLWKTLYSDGVKFISIPFYFNQPVNINDKVLLADFNGDGKTDILHSFNFFVNGAASDSRFSMYYSTGMNNPFYYEQSYYNKTIPYAESDMVTGDFNGDGSTDVLLKSWYGGAADIAYFKPKNQQKLLQKITTGHGITTTLTHKLMTSDTDPVYNRSVDLSNPINQAPFNYIKLPMYLLSSISTPNSIGGVDINYFFYENAMMHKLGKGLLGFKTTFSSNNVTGNVTSTENEFNTQFAIPFTVKQSVRQIMTNNLLSETRLTNTIQDLSPSILNKRYFQKVDKTVSIDYINDKATESINTFDNYGNVVNNIVKVGLLSGNTVLPTETIQSVSTFIGNVAYDPNLSNESLTKPINITITKVRNGMPTITATNTFTYTSNGLRTSETSFSGLPNAVTTSYTYNNFGNPISITTSSQGLANRYASTDYDTKGRFTISNTKTGQGLSQTETFVVDNKFGNTLQHTTTDCLTYNNQYDVFGKLTNSIFPDGTTAEFNNVWQTSDIFGSPNTNKLFYSFTHFSGGKPDTKTYVNKFNQEWRQETVSMYGAEASWHTISTTYDYRGNIKTKSNLYFPFILNPPSNPNFTQPVETPRITTYFYDVLNRVTKISNDIGDVTYNYELLGNGKNKISITNPANQTNSQIIDETGKIISSIDNGGQLDFFYDSRGNQTEVKRNGLSLVSNTFDIYGKQTSTTDINAGTISYTYDAYGQIKQQIDALGNTTNMLYDDFGRLLSRLGGEGLTTYEYYQDPSNNCSNNNVKRIVGFNAVIKEFTFDALKRISTETQIIDGLSSTKTYLYNNYGQVRSTIYPSGLEIGQNYDMAGYLKSVYYTRPFPNSTIFKNGFVDGEGRYLKYSLGLDKVTNNAYEKDNISTTITSGIRNLYYDFNHNTGNLKERGNNLTSQSESFMYDNLNRLNNSTTNNILQNATTYDQYSSQNGTGSIGNIITKTDAGYYKYRNNKINALAYIMNTPLPNQLPVTPIPSTNISMDYQDITYTSFLKVATIGEGTSYGGAYLEYTYGPDYQRVKSNLRYGRRYNETRYYFDDYEKQIINGVEREIHYINGGNGLCAMIVKEAGVINANIVYTDHLGSITTVTNFNGSAIVAQQSFDAWGRNRNPNNWNDYNYYNTTPQTPKWLYRGYTGHEMLPEFSLINMNGRMYDPLVGRMLSPDILIPAPYNTQGYNRYTYAYNNPLNYTDPDGNDPVTISIIIGAAVGGYFGGVTANGGQFNPIKWSNSKTLGYVVGGAIIGGISGYVGGTAAASGLPFSNTMGIVTSSFTNSVGMNILTGGKVPVSVGFGAASLDLQSGEFNYLGKSGNSFLTNLGYGFGALANLQDLVTNFSTGDYQYQYEVNKEQSKIGHGNIREVCSDVTEGTPSTVVKISVANKNSIPTTHTGLRGALEYAWKANFKKFSGGPDYWLGVPEKGWARIHLTLNSKIVNWMAKNLSKNKGLWGIDRTRFGINFGCVSYAARALWTAGVPTIPIINYLGPKILWLQLAVRQAGIDASPYLYNFK